MTVYVEESSKSVLSGLSRMKAAMIEDYNREHGYEIDNSILAAMRQSFANGFELIYGSKYIKIIHRARLARTGPRHASIGVVAFVVGVDTDKKFRKGDILKPAGWKAPARNKARGNILDGGYTINWTGPLYLEGLRKAFEGEK